VTGATGFIGSTLVEKLNRHPETSHWKIRVLTRESSSLENLEGASFERINADLSKPKSLSRALEGVNIVFHAAGVVSARSREDFFTHNVEGTENIALAIKNTCQHFDRMVYFSSLAAGGPMEIARERCEEDPDEPVSFYGESKLESERRLRSYSQYFPITVLRPPLVYGPKDKGVFVFVKTARTGIIPVIPADTSSGEKYFSVIHADDLCDLALQAVLTGNRVGQARETFEIFYAAGDGVYSFAQIMTAIKKGLNRKAIFVKTPKSVVRAIAQIATLTSKVTRKTYPLTNDKLHELFADYWLCSNVKAKERLGFVPKVGLEAGFQKTIDWYRQKEWISS
jgi:dihydroflavonol-4-reductase